MRILLTLMFLWPAASLADFTRYYPDTKPFLQEDLRLPYLPLVDDLVTGLCWTNVDEAREAIWRPLSDLGIETARATGNYIELIVKGGRQNEKCVGHASIRLLVDAYPAGAAYSDNKPPLLSALIAEDSQLISCADTLNLQVLDFTKRFMSQFVAFMTSD